MENEKRAYRQLKRERKRAGNRDRRNYLKRQLRDNPNEAHWDEFSYGNNSTEEMNGKYPDTKRRSKQATADGEPDFEGTDSWPGQTV